MSTTKSHLGNIRVNYTLEKGSLVILDEQHYYPFGLKHGNYNPTRKEFRKAEDGGNNDIVVITEVENSGYMYKYQEQERQDELGLNWDSFKWRNYDYAIGRFMSVDPLAEDYVYNGVYNFSENRVIDGRELEGLEWASVKDKNGKTTVTLTVQLYNDAGLSSKQLTKLKTSITNQFTQSYSGGNITSNLVIQDVTAAKGDMLVTLNTQKSTPIKDKNGNVIAEKYRGGKAGDLGKTQNNNFEVTAKKDGTKRSNSDIARSFSHEAGHTAGLRHPWDSKNTVSDAKQGSTNVTAKAVKNNLMNTGANTVKANRSTSGTQLTKGQLKSVNNLINKQQQP